MNSDLVFVSIRMDDPVTFAQVRAARKWLDDYIYHQDLAASVDAIKQTPAGYDLEIAFGPDMAAQDFDALLAAIKTSMKRHKIRAFHILRT